MLLFYVLVLFSSSGIDFLGDTVGLANKYAMCSESSAGVNQVFMIGVSNDFLAVNYFLLLNKKIISLKTCCYFSGS